MLRQLEDIKCRDKAEERQNTNVPRWDDDGFRTSRHGHALNPINHTIDHTAEHGYIKGYSEDKG